jgi:hypothetical protein
MRGLSVTALMISIKHSSHLSITSSSFKHCASLQSYGTGKRLVQSVHNAGEQSEAAVKTAQKFSEWLKIAIRTKAEDPATPSECITCLERLIDDIQCSMMLPCCCIAS